MVTNTSKYYKIINVLFILLICIFLFSQSYLISAINLTDVDTDLYQLLRQIHYQPVEFNANRLKHISLPQCTNKIARTTFETALKGVFS